MEIKIDKQIDQIFDLTLPVLDPLVNLFGNKSQYTRLDGSSYDSDLSGMVVFGIAGMVVYHSIEGIESKLGIIKPEMTLIIASAVLMRGFNMFYRSQKLLKGLLGKEGGYVFCDKPPEKETKERKMPVGVGGVAKLSP